MAVETLNHNAFQLRKCPALVNCTEAVQSSLKEYYKNQGKQKNLLVTARKLLC